MGAVTTAVVAGVVIVLLVLACSLVTVREGRAFVLARLGRYHGRPWFLPLAGLYYHLRDGLRLTNPPLSSSR
jgi:regulator of protease activity HflC (stomatin/prohibitin superfamily)